MYLELEELVMLIISISGFSLMIYGLITLIKNIAKKYKEKVESETGKPNLEIKKDILDAVKLLFGAQVVCLLFYITPAINENIKIMLSLIITLGSFIVTFLIKEQKGYNNLCRGLIFVGQEFFGITMLLMMINKGMGYSITVIFTLWSAFNFYIMKQFGKLENKMFFWITLIALMISLLGSYVDDISSVFAVVVIAIILLLIHIFNNKETIGVSLVSNILFVLLFVAGMQAMIDTYKTPFTLFIITAILVIALSCTKIVERKLNLKSLLLYIPFVVLLLLVGFEEDIIMCVSLFNIMVAANIASPKSICKKILSLIVLLFLTVWVGEVAVSNELVSVLIYLCSVVYVGASLFTPSKKIEITEGGDCNE